MNGNETVNRLLEAQQRAHSPWLAAGLASEFKIDRMPYGRRFLAACCEVLQLSGGSGGMLFLQNSESVDYGPQR